MSKDDENKRLRDTTKPEHRPSWSKSRDNAPKGATPINWGDRGVPVPTPGGTKTTGQKTGLFANNAPTRAPSPARKVEEKPPQERKLTGLFSEKARETREDQVLKTLSGGDKGRAPASDPKRSTSARIEPEKPDRKPVFRRNWGRDDDRGR